MNFNQHIFNVEMDEANVVNDVGEINSIDNVNINNNTGPIDPALRFDTSAFDFLDFPEENIGQTDDDQMVENNGDASAWFYDWVTRLVNQGGGANEHFNI